MLVNGLPGASISPLDRGLNYGDGVFRTLLLRQGRPHAWSRHYLKLSQDCAALHLECPLSDTLLGDIATLSETSPDGVLKIVITRGDGQRGYAIPAKQNTVRVLSISPMPVYEHHHYASGIKLHRCRLKLGNQPRLAGIKHLNRLENVIAASECSEAGLPEGLLEDENGLLVSGTRSNLFLFKDQTLYTPDLSRCGVAGVQRARVMDWARACGVECKIVQMNFEEMLRADEIFMVNSVFGLWPVGEVASYKRHEHPNSWKIQEWLNDENN